ncbi:hypothetical protein BMETH_2567_1 [methanotrophic bacterial endosymbiont of Bathymodiolus sp.]|nr:hypothetical protein BMETH_2567_1 [methanotrophic bacterial endosymbiont of Bathymodiolus sp.]
MNLAKSNQGIAKISVKKFLMGTFWAIPTDRAFRSNKING